MGRTRALRNVKDVELEGIPNLTKCSLVTSFKCVESVKIENVSKLGEFEALKEGLMRKKEEEERKRTEEEEQRRKEVEEAATRKAVIESLNDWDSVDKTVGTVVIGDNCCNESGFDVLDLSGFVNLVYFVVGNRCFTSVCELKVIGLKELEYVIIGIGCFTVFYEDVLSIVSDPDRHFYLKDCPSLLGLKIGHFSFMDCSVFEIENVNSLQAIEIGDTDNLDQMCYDFFYASLELRSVITQVN